MPEAFGKQVILKKPEICIGMRLGFFLDLYFGIWMTGRTVSQAEDQLTDEILKKRAEAHPGLNQRLNLGLWNQPLASVIRTIVNAGGFQLDLVPGTPQ